MIFSRQAYPIMLTVLKNILLKWNTKSPTSLTDMTIKLTDFNVSKWSQWDDRSATQTSAVGSPAFRAPEVLLHRGDGKTHYGTPADIWSVGVLVFEMWTKGVFASEKDICGDGLFS